jgi:hypothetical protein
MIEFAELDVLNCDSNESPRQCAGCCFDALPQGANLSSRIYG